MTEKTGFIGLGIMGLPMKEKEVLLPGNRGKDQTQISLFIVSRLSLSWNSTPIKKDLLSSS